MGQGSLRERQNSLRHEQDVGSGKVRLGGVWQGRMAPIGFNTYRGSSKTLGEAWRGTASYGLVRHGKVR